MNKIEIVEGWESRLTPGQLYTVFTTEEDGQTGEPYNAAGSFVYWTGSLHGLVYEDGDDFNGDVDYLVALDGTHLDRKSVV